MLTLQALLKPLIPETVSKLEKLTGIVFEKWPELVEVVSQIPKLKPEAPKPLFAKIDLEIIKKEQAKLKNNI